MNQNPSEKTIIEDETEESSQNVYFSKVILFNDLINDFGHVEDCLMKICFKSKKEAKKIALEAHNNGKAICFIGSSEECETVAEKLSAEHLTVSINN
ncbi:ATP-dependent Clp protease adaptor ClpS [Leptospira ilyithenensis]|uniref:ATP-dependent Clp protease adaptor ClpS n=2 Tax=Leptospira ilyithenensis TaxID=2484901 RepID=A0A4R9LSL7_9LEPT|nr:ATP-dependent Clp protease adaptor ClpS [Leptospira ilyithenensis]